MNRGRFGDEPVPETGEAFIPIVSAAGVTIEEIVSASAAAETVYDQDHAEWVMLVSGGARLTVGDAAVSLTAGDWLWLPAGVRHTVDSVDPGTRWLAVHLPASAEADPGPD